MPRDILIKVKRFLVKGPIVSHQDAQGPGNFGYALTCEIKQEWIFFFFFK